MQSIVPQIRRLQAVLLLMTMALVLPSPIYPYFFTTDLGLSSAQYGQVVGATSLTHLGAAICYGRLSDAIGRRRVIIFQCTLSMILYSSLALLSHHSANAPDLVRPLLLAVFIALGFCNTVNLLTCTAVCDLCSRIKQQTPSFLCRSASADAVPPTNALSNERPKFLAQVAGVLGLAGIFGPLLGQAAQALGGDPARPTVCLALSAAVSGLALIIAFDLQETNRNAKSIRYFLKTLRMCACGRSHIQHASPLLSDGASSSHPSPCQPVTCEMVMTASCELTSSGPETTDPQLTQHPTPTQVSPPNGPEIRYVRPFTYPPFATSPPAPKNVDLEEWRPASEGTRNVEESNETDCVSHQLTTRQMWTALSVTYASQAVKALSLSTISVCYALVLDAMLPSGWLFGLTRTQVLAVGLAYTSLIRVAIQLSYFQRFLKWVGGPGRVFLLGTVLMSVGQFALYWTLRYLPDVLGIRVNPKMWSTLLFASIHFLTVGGIFAIGLACTEPSLTTLIALCVADRPKYQGTAQGLNSASNLLGATIGPPLFGYLLGTSARKKASEDQLSPTRLMVEPVAMASNVVNQDTTSVVDRKGMTRKDGIAATEDELAAAEDELAATEDELARTFPASLDRLWPLTVDEMAALPVAVAWRKDTLGTAESVIDPAETSFSGAGLVFYSGGILALVPLLWGRKLLKIAHNWQSR